MENKSYYQLKRDRLIFSDLRMDIFKHDIFAFLNELKKNIDPLSGLGKKIEDCEHKIHAVNYHLTLIRSEVKKGIPLHTSEMRGKLGNFTEFQNDILIFETESFLFQIQAALDILVQVLKYQYPTLKDKRHPEEDVESFRGLKHIAGASTIKDLCASGDMYDKLLADFFEIEVSKWIQEMNEMRNTIAHRSGLEGFACFTIDHRHNDSVKEPILPSGKNLQKYCEETFSSLLNLYENIFKNFIN